MSVGQSAGFPSVVREGAEGSADSGLPMLLYSRART